MMAQTFRHDWTAINASDNVPCDRCEQLLRARVDFITLGNGLHATLCRPCAATVQAQLIMEGFDEAKRT